MIDDSGLGSGLESVLQIFLYMPLRACSSTGELREAMQQVLP